MKKILLKLALYVFLVLISLEIIVRVLHLYTEDPPRFIDEQGVEKRVPGHNGYAVTGNRNQNFTEFRINKAGFNSSREFLPTKDKFEVAIIGDSFIEGFHQNYYDSTGKKIESKVDYDVEVYEYGYAGYDLANQMHLIHTYKQDFELIDKTIIYLNYESDLERGKYTPNEYRIRLLSSTMFRIRDNIKLLAYASKTGILQPVIDLVQGKKSEVGEFQFNEPPELKIERDKKYLENFENLVQLYGYDKQKTVMLLDSRKTSTSFLKYCDTNGFKYIDFAAAFKSSKQPTTLIYDWHWNNHGRELIAEVVADYLNENKK